MHYFHADITGLIILIVTIYLVVTGIMGRRANERAAIRNHELEMERAKQLGQFLTEKEYTKMLKDIDKASLPVANDTKEEK